jgi:hypothetical protein
MTQAKFFRDPLEERLQSRTSDLVALTKTMLPVIRHSISEARKQFRTGQQDIRTYFTDTQRQNQTRRRFSDAPIAPTITTVRTNSHLLAVQQRFQHAGTQATKISRDIRQFWRRSAR